MATMLTIERLTEPQSVAVGTHYEVKFTAPVNGVDATRAVIRVYA